MGITIITIREQSQTATGFNVVLAIDGNNYNVTVSDPFNTWQEEELEWYFESWLRYPNLDNVKAEKAKVSVREYGEALFKQIFQADLNAYSRYSQLRGDLSQVKLEIASITPEFQAIHWEALQDPDLPRPLAIDAVTMRKSTNPAAIAAKVKESPTVNLLVVIARPNGDRDIGYRTISRPLVEAIRNAKLRVKVELLRPGTYEALEKHLESKGSGYYHIVHFDVHGALKSYADFQSGVEDNRYLYQGRYGRGIIEPYEGKKAFLALEGETVGEYDLVEASEIASLLTGKGIPVCILNACQSGKQLRGYKASVEDEIDVSLPPDRDEVESPLAPLDRDEVRSPLAPLDRDEVRSPLAPLSKGGMEDNRETSLGSRLMNAGMQMVVAMSYSITVSAAEILMQQIYTHLFDHQDLNRAIRLGRRELYNRKARKAYYNTEIDLEDWILPVTYGNGEVDFKLRNFTPEEEEQYYLSQDSEYRFTQPTYGFVGRDVDILLIEKALLKHNMLLLQGMGGTGKTTLLNYLREWWQVTNFAQQIFYFGYDEKAYTRQQIVYEIGKQLYSRFDFSQFQAYSPTVQWRKLADKLRAESHILILDNLESVTGQPLAIQNTLDEPAREEIKQFLTYLVGGNTKVVLGSRIAEEWLAASTFGDNKYRLRGLDPQARSNLAENILQRVNSSQSLSELKTDRHFTRLMKLLAGYPLAMEVVLTNLKNQSPAEILEQLDRAEINEAGEDKTNNIIKCIDYSHSNLSPSAQKLLLLLAPFRGFIYTEVISYYVEELAKLKPFQDYALVNLTTAVAEAVNWGLLSPIDKDFPQLLTIQPVLPYFLNTKLKEVAAETRAALQAGFKNHYRALAAYYDSLLESKEAQERQMGIAFIRWEYENLYQALQICLAQKERVYTIWICLYDYLDLTGNKSENFNLTNNLYQALDSYSLQQRDGDWEKDIIPIAGNLAACYLENQEYKRAKDIYLNTIELIPQFNSIDTSQKQSYLATIYHQLGRVAEELREYSQARDYYNQALEIKIEYGDRISQASTLHHLGIVAQELKEYSQARDYDNQALEIKIEYGDRFSQALTLHHLGIVAQELKEYSQARDYFNQALDIWIEYGDRFSQARTLHQLGNVAQQLREYSQARDYFNQALDIWIEYGDRYSQAYTLHNLGIVAQELKEYSQARDYYNQALDIKIEYGDRYSQAYTLHHLGIVAQELREYSQAGDYYNQALEIWIEYGDRYNQASTLHELGIVAQELREYSQARDYYNQALDIWIEYGDRYSQALTLHQLGRVAQELREYSQARDYYNQALEIYIEYGDRYSQARTLHNLGSVAEELREYPQARDYYNQALQIKIEYGDRFSQASTYFQLGRVAEELSDLEEAKAYYYKDLEITAESNDEHGLEISLRNLARLYQKTNDSSILTKIAAVFNCTEAEVKELCDRFNQNDE